MPTYVAFYEFGQIYVPDFEGYGECEQFNPTFINLMIS